VPTAISELRSNEIEVLFNQFDTDGSGLIDADELQAALSKDGRELSKAEVLEILDTVDTNSDGSVSYDEFERIFTLSPDELPVGVQPLVDATRSERIAGLDRRVGDLDAQIAMLKEERSLILDKRRDVQNWYDEVRFEVSGTQLNAPILFTTVAALFLVLVWKYVVGVSLLYQDDMLLEAGWLPESLHLLQSIPSGFLADYQQAVHVSPLLTMACTSCFSYAVGDLVAQRVEGRWRAGLLDLGRSARNAALGFSMHGPLVYGWILLLEGPLAQLVGPNDQWSSVLIKIVLDQTLFSAFLNLLYATLNFVLSDLSLSEAFAKARRVLVPAMVSSWRFWPAVQLISFSPLIPVDFKLLWIDTMEILWVAYLSTTISNSAAPGERDAIPWGEGWEARRKLEGGEDGSLVLDEPGDSDLLSVGPAVLAGAIALGAAVSWPALVIQLMTV